MAATRRPLALLTVALALGFAAPTTAHAADLLPDLDQRLPGGVEVVAERSGAIPRFHLGFASAVANVGRGTLIVDAHRSSRQRRMIADQLVLQSDGSRRRVRGVGRLRYTISPDHRHWHYLGFDRYELRRASDYLLIAPDRKTGFCLGDRYAVEPLPGSPPEPFFTSRCGLGKPARLHMREGISPGYGDNYEAVLEGQFVDVTGVAPGRYYLVHRANSDRRLLESDYGNDAASILISITWPRGRTQRPRIGMLGGCEDAQACPGDGQAPPVLDGLAARHYARVALRRALGFSPLGFRFRCAAAAPDGSRDCTARGHRGALRYSAAVTVRYETDSTGVLYAGYSLTARRSDSVAVPSAAGRVRIVKLSPASASLQRPLMDGLALGVYR